MTDDYLEHLVEAGTELARLHRELLTLEAVDFGAGGFGARIEPYRSRVRPGGTLDLEVLVRNPFARVDEAEVVLALPAGWTADPLARRASVEALGESRLAFCIRAGPTATRRARIAADLTVGGVRFGQQAEALVTVR